VRPFEELEEAEVVGSSEESDKLDSATNMTNGDKTNGKRGLDALPILSSAAFTPISTISSSAVASYLVSSSNNTALQQQQNGNHHSDATDTKVINIGPSLVAKSTDCDRCCFGCLKIIGCKPLPSLTTSDKGKNREAEETESILRFQCPECKNVFCPDCDAYLHETLHNCPGCLCT
jgi:transcription factor Ssl1